MEKEHQTKLVGQIFDFGEYEYIEHLKDRVIIFNDEVSETLVEKVIIQILKWNREDEGKDIKDRKKITILLNTPGGDVYLGMVIVDVIQKSVTPIEIQILGMAASMGSLIAIAGHKRMAYKHSNILIHDGSTVLYGSSNKVKDHMKYQEVKDKQIKDFIVSNTKITEEKYMEMIDREWWLTAEQALEYGIIDEII